MPINIFYIALFILLVCTAIIGTIVLCICIVGLLCLLCVVYIL